MIRIRKRFLGIWFRVQDAPLRRPSVILRLAVFLEECDCESDPVLVARTMLW
jgi:hypothetical protein